MCSTVCTLYGPCSAYSGVNAQRYYLFYYCNCFERDCEHLNYWHPSSLYSVLCLGTLQSHDYKCRAYFLVPCLWAQPSDLPTLWWKEQCALRDITLLFVLLVSHHEKNFPLGSGCSLSLGPRKKLCGAKLNWTSTWSRVDQLSPVWVSQSQSTHTPTSRE